MAIAIETFSNTTGGSSLFKALGHPEAVAPAQALFERLSGLGPIALYDPLGQARAFGAFHDLSRLPIADLFVQDVERVGETYLGHSARPVTELAQDGYGCIFVAAFEADRLVDHVRHLVPDGAVVLTLDEMRIPEDLLTDRRRYLAPLNFATNFSLFRDVDGQHTRIFTANYWGGYGAKAPKLWATLFGENGERLATWMDPMPPANGTIVIDSAEVRSRFDLPDFVGQLFLHIVGAAGHDVVKYALDTYGDDASMLSCTHDANAWPSDLYAGLPAPQDGETVILWVQNSHPSPIPARAVGLNLMGADQDSGPGSDGSVSWLDREVPGFGTYRLDVAELLPNARWPEQIEAQAGKHFVRPRYEILRSGNGQGSRQRIAHMNVERTDLRPDPRLPEIGNLMGKGFVLPAPLLPPDRYRTQCLPTPMSTGQRTMPVALTVFDADGSELAHHSFGVLPRNHTIAADVDDILQRAERPLRGAWGHVELIYDFDADVEGGNEGDGWLHAIFRYEDRETGHVAETSFGSHMFNTVLTYGNEPQSYAGRAPGLSTRLFLSTGPAGTDAICHLTYAASTPWHDQSRTLLSLMDRNGAEIASRSVSIPCGGSFLFRVKETFAPAEIAAAGKDCYVLIRDTTCRLFGYHGLVADGGEAFSFDHMFGF